MALKRRLHTRVSALVVFAAVLAVPVYGVTPTPEEFQTVNSWTAAHFEAGDDLPFSFLYDGRNSSGFLANWTKSVERRVLDDRRTQETLAWVDPKTGLELRCIAVQYSDFPVIEWTMYFRNTGSTDTPVLENIQALDTDLTRDKGTEFLLHYERGDFNIPESYEPFEQKLFPNTTLVFSPVGGRPTNSAFPYYDIEQPGGGMIMAVGWPGEWQTSFQRHEADKLRVLAGQQLTHLSLKPGEEVRGPLIALLFWRGNDFLRAQNLWRRWMLADNLPRIEGQLPNPMYVFCNGAYSAGMKTDEAGQKEFIDALIREKIKVDYWWIDAGWYPCKDNWSNTGTWKPDPQRYPNGIKSVSEYAHDRDMKLVLWFEPERVTAGSWLAENHPEWLLGGKLLNLGNPAARSGLTNYIDRFLREQGVDVYRQDFNMDPLQFWRDNDRPDRQGMTENLHVQGYLAYWDELRGRNPNLLIDSCASGGRRNDLETMRRAVPLLRSDYQAFDSNPDYARGNQGHTYGLSFWFPYYGQGVYPDERDPIYYVRSHFSPAFGIAVDVRKPVIPWDVYRGLVADWRKVASRMLGDYYPLTPYSTEDDKWIAWQFDRPEQGDGIVQAFRRARSVGSSLRLKLRALQADSRYKVVDFDTGRAGIFSARELMDPGLLVTLSKAPGSAILSYERVQGIITEIQR